MTVRVLMDAIIAICVALLLLCVTPGLTASVQAASGEPLRSDEVDVYGLPGKEKVRPGKGFVYNLSLHNNQNLSDVFTFSISEAVDLNGEGFRVALEYNSIRIESDENGTLAIFILTPREMWTDGDYEIPIHIHSRNNETILTVSIEMHVKGIYFGGTHADICMTLMFWFMIVVILWSIYDGRQRTKRMKVRIAKLSGQPDSPMTAAKRERKE